MGKENEALMAFLDQNRIIARLFNQHLFDGNELIEADKLSYLPILSLKDEGQEREEEILRNVITKTNGNFNVQIIGVDSDLYDEQRILQKVMLCNVAVYEDEMPEVGIPKLNPVITLVVNFTGRKWSQPTSMHEAVSDTLDKEFLEKYPNYNYKLLDPFQLSDEELEKFGPVLSGVFKYEKYKDNPEKLKELIEKDGLLESLTPLTVEVLNDCFDAGLEPRETV